MSTTGVGCWSTDRLDREPLIGRRPVWEWWKLD